MSIVYDAYKIYLRDKKDGHDVSYAASKAKQRWSKGNLWPTDVGKACHRAAILRATGIGREDYFETSGLDYMNTGIITEDETFAALKHIYGDNLKNQVELKYKMWSGKADFCIDIGGENPIIIEHKTTSEKNFDSDQKTSLPKKEHIGQVVVYQWMYERLYGIKPRILLFYKAWGNFAEFELIPEKEVISIVSNVNGVLDVVLYNYNVEAEINELMGWYDSQELPPKLDKKYKGCEFMGKPSCSFYKNCWG